MTSPHATASYFILIPTVVNVMYCVSHFDRTSWFPYLINQNQKQSGDKVPVLHTDKYLPINEWKSRDFEMQEQLGKGRYGEVCKAINRKDKKVYAIKKINKEKDITEALIRNEIEMQRKSSSKFVVQLYNAFQDSTAYYLQLELVEGGMLANLMRSYGRFSEDTTRFYAAEILCALEYIHKNGIVFRDLKPENILLTHEGHIKIADFGISTEEIKIDDKTDNISGTLGYIAPEVLSDQPYTKVVDVWALGVIIYTMIAGYKPFYGINQRQIILTTLFVTVVYDKSNFSVDAEDLIKHLLDRDPTKRYTILQTKKDKWFANNKTNWSKVENQKYEPPFRPQYNGYIEKNTQKFIKKQK